MGRCLPQAGHVVSSGASQGLPLYSCPGGAGDTGAGSWEEANEKGGAFALATC